MKINEQIREYRKKMGLTQEQVASALGITAPAVNKWEKGSSYPDITLLPPLARLLKVDLNTLLCFNEELTKSEIAQFTSDIIKTVSDHGLEHGFALAMDKIHEYPSCIKLIHTIALTLDGAVQMSGLDAESKDSFNSKVTELYECVAESEDKELRERSLFMLASRYMIRGDLSKAQEMLDNFPERDVLDKRQLQAELYIRQNELEKAAVLLENKLLWELQKVQSILLNLADISIKEGNAQNALDISDLSRQSVELFGLWDYCAYIVPLEVSVAQKDTEECLIILNAIFQALQIRWKSEETVLFSRTAMAHGKEMLAKSNQLFPSQAKKWMIPTLLNELENNPKYDFLRSNKKYQELIHHYRTVCTS